MPSATVSDTTQERARSDVRATNGRKSSSERQDPRTSKQQIRQATASSEDAIAQLVPAWVNASSAFIPAAYYNPGQVLSFGFDVQQQMLTLQRKFWGELLNASQKNVQARTIHQDPDEIGYWVENE